VFSVKGQVRMICYITFESTPDFYIHVILTSHPVLSLYASKRVSRRFRSILKLRFLKLRYESGEYLQFFPQCLLVEHLCNCLINIAIHCITQTQSVK